MGQREITIVDIGANPIDGEPCYMHLVNKGLAKVYGFEPQPAAYAKLQSTENKVYLPYAICDGHEHTLYICASDGMTSLFEPDFENLSKLDSFAHHAEVIERRPISTLRLSQVPELQGVQVDILRMDCQGSEHRIINYSSEWVQQCTIIELEVSFITLYKGQQDFCEMNYLLKELGFEFHHLLTTKQWKTETGVRWLEADAVFINKHKPISVVKDLLDKVY